MPAYPIPAMHTPTLLILATILMALMAAVIAVVRHFNRHIAGLSAWATSYLCGVLACLALLGRSQVNVVSVAVVQTLFVATAYLSLAGARAYMGRPRISRRLSASALATLIGTSAYLTAVEPNPALRITISNVVCGMLFLSGALTLSQGGRRLYPARYCFALACAGHGVFLILRSWILPWNAQGALIIDLTISVSAFVILESILALVLMAFGVLMLAHEHTATALRRLAERDSLTGVFNRRSFMILLDKAAHLASRMDTPLSVLTVDLDHFKRINDTWGHQSGDLALCHFVSVATHCLRNADLLGRIGGEEFAIYLPNTTLDEAAGVAERLRAELAARPAPGQRGPIALTASIGLALCPRGEAPEITIHRADQAMYLAKHRGRNRVEIAAPAPAFVPAKAAV